MVTGEPARLRARRKVWEPELAGKGPGLEPRGRVTLVEHALALRGVGEPPLEQALAWREFGEAPLEQVTPAIQTSDAMHW